MEVSGQSSRGPFTPEKLGFSAHRTECSVGLRVALSRNGTSAVKLTAHRHTDWAISSSKLKLVKKKATINTSWRPKDLWDIDDPTFSRKSVHRWWWGWQSYAPNTLYSPRRFLILISVRVNPKAILRLEGFGKLRKFNRLIGDSKPRPSGL
jgi:hypothetical protein